MRIGITCNRVGYENRLSMAYVRAVAHTGAVPLLLPVCANMSTWKQFTETVDAILLSGGSDPDAQHYGEEATPQQGHVLPDRDSMELYLARYALRNDLPILGICRGAQIMAVAAGGSLHQDITEVQHLQHDQKAPRAYPIHHVTVEKTSMLHQITKQEIIRVNSLHHQAIRNPGPTMSVCAVANDGIIEAVEVPTHPFALGVQWHPEWLWRQYAHAASLFFALQAAVACAK
ncbi:MAG: gamma-glutamyl-gamma-aminobutyrate hydrolase family protein [Firmicutes bacterium]|nr:gamma-glutamyl-gamma-aminobutyrate hydrolase family protein [Bacillota bacterium]